MTSYAFDQKLTDNHLPPMPARRRLAANSWEQNWWLDLEKPILRSAAFDSFSVNLSDHSILVRLKMRTTSKLSLVVTSIGVAETDVFQRTMELMLAIEGQFGAISKIEGRSATNWPYRDFQTEVKTKNNLRKVPREQSQG